MEITIRDIERAERILLPEGLTFDEERRNFIRRLESCDLLAVPGSGKTTALQAKLCCLAHHLPLYDGQGILVLSHTNNAIDEIKKKLRTDCYQLFESPHFIGTVQDFVDTFLAIPFYELKYKKKVHIIDKEAYKQEVERFLNINCPKAVYPLRYKNFDFSDIYIHKNDEGNYEYTKGDYSALTFPNIKKWVNEGTVDAKHREILEYILSMKSAILNRGVLSYNDCYILAKDYLTIYPFVTRTLRKKFKYIFIDETQDLKKYQLDLIDKIFDCEECCLQRIGDKNQTIYQRPDRAIPDQWIVRNPQFLNNSLRLTPTIAKVVNPFTVDTSPDAEGNPKFVVIGKRKIEQDDIPPHLIIFDKESKDRLLPCFDELINIFNLRNTYEGKKYGFHTVGWTVKNDDKGSSEKLRLKDIFPNCRKQSDKGLNSYSTLSEFIVYGCRERNMSDCKSVICKILVCVLRLIRKTDEGGRYYSKTSMEKYINTHGEQVCNNYLSMIYKATRMLYLNSHEVCYLIIKNYILHDFTSLFGISDGNTIVKAFCEKEFNSALKHTDRDENYSDIVIGSVHSVKGQTHCATMYVETSYKGYESEHLFKKRKPSKKNPNPMQPSPLFQESHKFHGKVTSLSAMRMMYVGFSRPTHLLCYAVFKENWTDEMIARMERLGWRVLKL